MTLRAAAGDSQQAGLALEFNAGQDDQNILSDLGDGPQLCHRLLAGAGLLRDDPGRTHWLFSAGCHHGAGSSRTLGDGPADPGRKTLALDASGRQPTRTQNNPVEPPRGTSWTLMLCSRRSWTL